MEQPKNIDAERALLGSIMILNGIPQGIKLEPEDFYLARHKTIAETMLAIVERGGLIDYITLVSELEKSGRLKDIGGRAYIAEIVNTPDMAMNVEYYAHIVYEMARRREIIQKAKEAASIAYDLNGNLGEAFDILSTAKKNSTNSTWAPQFIPQKALSEPPEPIEWIVQGLFSRGSLAIIFGPPGSKKSYILADMATCIANGKPWLETIELPDKRIDGFVTAQTPVLWIDLDNGKRVTRNRFSAILRGHNGTPDNLYLVSMPSPWPFMDRDEPAEFLLNTIQQYNIGVVVIDNLGHITGDVDENSSEMAKVMGRLRRIVDVTNTAILIIHHSRKSDITFRGSSAIEAALDNAYAIVPDENDHQRAVFRPTKIRDGKWPKPLTIIGNFMEDPDSPPDQSILESVSFSQSPTPTLARNDMLLIFTLFAISKTGAKSKNAVIEFVRSNWDYDDAIPSKPTILNAITTAKSRGLVSSKKNTGSRATSLYLTDKGAFELQIYKDILED